MNRVSLTELVRAGERIHLVGIGGAGMSGLALLLQARGAVVSGSDRAPSPAVEELARKGMKVHIGHSRDHVEGCAAVIHTAAVSPDHPELVAAREAGSLVVKRSEALAQLVNEGRLVGVAGTHGKTTTTALVALSLEGAGGDPTALVGGRLDAWGGNARIGASDLFVVEADEYDRSFLALEPDVAVVTSMEAEHLDTYSTVEEMESAFESFIERVPAGGKVVACIDDPGAARCLERAGARGLSYGIGPGAVLRAEAIDYSPQKTRFEAHLEGEKLSDFEIALQGSHNVRNTLAAIGVTLALGFDPKSMVAALAEFKGVDRRFQVLGEAGGITIVDDYAHHPTEIIATLEAARQAFGERRIVVVFQPHLFSRTRALAAEFGAALAKADLAFVAPIYPAREAPIEGVDAGLVVAAARRLIVDKSLVREVASLDEAVGSAISALEAGDVLFTLGAGDVDQVGRRVLERLRRSHVDA